MQNYLEQLDKINNLLSQQPSDFWTMLWRAALLLLSLLLLIVGVAIIYRAKPIRTLFGAAVGAPEMLRRTGYIISGIVVMMISSYIAPEPNTVPAESERTIHNMLMDMNEVDYKTLVDGTNKYQLSNSEQAKYKTIINIIQKASKVRPVK